MLGQVGVNMVVKTKIKEVTQRKCLGLGSKAREVGDIAGGWGQARHVAYETDRVTSC